MESLFTLSTLHYCLITSPVLKTRKLAGLSQKLRYSCWVYHGIRHRTGLMCLLITSLFVKQEGWWANDTTDNRAGKTVNFPQEWPDFYWTTSLVCKQERWQSVLHNYFVCLLNKI